VQGKAPWFPIRTIVEFNLKIVLFLVDLSPLYGVIMIDTTKSILATSFSRFGGLAMLMRSFPFIHNCLLLKTRDREEWREDKL